MQCRSTLLLLVFVLPVCFASCSGSEQNSKPAPAASSATGKTQLTEAQLNEVDHKVEDISSAAMKAAAGTKARDEKCVAECKQRLRDRVMLAKIAFNNENDKEHYHNTEWLNEALAAARTEFDACLVTCD